MRHKILIVGGPSCFGSAVAEELIRKQSGEILLVTPEQAKEELDMNTYAIENTIIPLYNEIPEEHYAPWEHKPKSSGKRRAQNNTQYSSRKPKGKKTHRKKKK